MFEVYLLYSIKFDSFYIGHTIDLKRRLEEHNSGKTRSTGGKAPWVVAYTEKFKTRIEAIQRELFLKKQRNKSFYKKLSGL